jgi:hypothetical protein
MLEEQIEGEQTKGNKVVNGWLLTTGTGNYGTKYLWRAGMADYGWGANLTKDAIYPSTKSDSSGAPLVGPTPTLSISRKARPRPPTASSRSRCTTPPTFFTPTL